MVHKTTGSGATRALLEHCLPLLRKNSVIQVEITAAEVRVARVVLRRMGKGDSRGRWCSDADPAGHLLSARCW